MRIHCNVDGKVELGRGRSLGNWRRAGGYDFYLASLPLSEMDFREGIARGARLREYSRAGVSRWLLVSPISRETPRERERERERERWKESGRVSFVRINLDCTIKARTRRGRERERESVSFRCALSFLFLNLEREIILLFADQRVADRELLNIEFEMMRRCLAAKFPLLSSFVVLGLSSR